MNNIKLDVLNKTTEAITADRTLKMRKWNARVTWKDGVHNELNIREFPTIQVDEPDTLGGTDTAPNPVEYLIGAAASCFAITFEVMASQQGVTLKHVEADIEADLNAAVFLGIEEGYGGVINPVIKLKVESSASEDQVREIAEAALAKSPVLASLKEEVKLVIEQ
ncbi:MAG: OsmC family protein [Bacillaceae bacterium]|nr:OsmC family protein [Bacillaceae bacterium]